MHRDEVGASRASQQAIADTVTDVDGGVRAESIQEAGQRVLGHGEADLHLRVLPQPVLIGWQPVRRASDYHPGSLQRQDRRDGNRPGRFPELERPVNVETQHEPGCGRRF